MVASFVGAATAGGGLADGDEAEEGLDDAFAADGGGLVAYRRPAVAAPLTRETRREHRRKSEGAMEDFVTAQLNEILRPVLQQVEALDARLLALQGGLADANAASTRDRAATAANASGLASLEGRLKNTDGRVAACYAALGETDKEAEAMRRDLDGAMADVRQTHHRLEDMDHGLVPQVQRELQAVEGKVQDVQDKLRAVNAAMADESVNRRLDEFNASLQDVRQGQNRDSGDLERMRSELIASGELLKETRGLTEKARAQSAQLQKGLQEVLAREAQLAGQLNGWKDQWSKLHPELQGATRDIAQLRRWCEHQEVATHGLQQGCAHNSAGVSALQRALERCCAEMEDAQRDLAGTKHGLAETRNELSQAVKFANGLHSAVEEGGRNMRKMTDSLEGLDRKQALCLEDLGRTTKSIMELMHEQLQAEARMGAVQQELQRAKEALSSTRGDLASASTNLDGLRGEMGKAKAALHRLDHGVEFCHAGFTGLQKGFVATGAQLQSRSLVLPSVSAGGRRATAEG